MIRSDGTFRPDFRVDSDQPGTRVGGDVVSVNPSNHVHRPAWFGRKSILTTTFGAIASSQVDGASKSQ